MVAELPAYFTFRPRVDQPDRYDQQTSFYNSKLPGVAWLIGGNGAGTTEVSLAKVAKFLLETPPPRYDTPFWIISETYEMVCKACWKEKLCPRMGHGHLPASEIDWDRIRWYRPNQWWPYEVPLKPWPDRPGKNWTLSFKSYKQGRSQMQAESIGGFLFVEQFPWGLLEEVLRGCREYDFLGAKLAEFTPIDPNLSIEIEDMIDSGYEPEDPKDRLPGRRYMPRDWAVYRANTECAMESGHVKKAWFDSFFATVSDEMRLTRMTGQFATYEGAIYKGFNPLVHLVDDDVIDFPPGVWYRRSIDWGAGPENAFVCLWSYRNGLGQWHVFDEYYSTDQEMTTVDHLCEVQNRFPWPAKNPYYGTTWADPSSPDNIRLATKLPVYAPGRAAMSIMRAANAVLEGIEHVQWLLKSDAALATPEQLERKARGENVTLGRPRLFIHKRNCPNLARQMRTYHWLKASENGLNPQNPRREPAKKDDHAVDALRYLTFSESRLLQNTPSAEPRERRAERYGVQLKGRR